MNSDCKPRGNSKDAGDSWQTILKGIKAKLRHLYEAKLFTDLTVKFGPDGEESVPCHQLILAMSSPVFETMLSERWKKCSSTTPTTSTDAAVNLVEDAQVFQLALQFMYTEEIPSDLEWEVVLDLLKFASVYHIQDLVDHCNDLLTSKLTEDLPTPRQTSASVVVATASREPEENGSSPAELVTMSEKEQTLEHVLPIYEKAIQLCQTKLKQIALNYVKKHANEILKTESFLCISHSALCQLLELDDLQVDSELVVFTAIYKWADQECDRQNLEVNIENRRRVLGPALHLVRFPALSPDVFATEVVNKALLSLEERVEVLTYMSMSKEFREKIDKLHYFHTQPRRSRPSSSRFTLTRFENVGPTDFDFSRNWRFLCFQVDKRIKIESLGFYGAYSGQNSEFEVRVSVSYMEQREEADPVTAPVRKLIYDSKKKIVVPGTQKVFQFELGESVPIDAGKEYSIGYIIMGPTTFMGDTLQECMTVDCFCTEGGDTAAQETVTFTFGLAKIKNNRFQIPEIGFTL